MGPNFVVDKGFLATTLIGMFRGVVLVGNDSIKQADAAAARPIGFSQDEVTAAADVNERTINIRILGITRAVNGTAGALARDAKVALDNQGRVVVATTGQAVAGITLTACTLQGDHLDLLLTPGVIA